MIPLIRKNLILSSDLSIILSLLSVLIFFYFIIDNSLAIMPDLATFIILQAFLHSDVKQKFMDQLTPCTDRVGLADICTKQSSVWIFCKFFRHVG